MHEGNRGSVDASPTLGHAWFLPGNPSLAMPRGTAVTITAATPLSAVRFYACGFPQRLSGCVVSPSQSARTPFFINSPRLHTDQSSRPQPCGVATVPRRNHVILRRSHDGEERAARI